jgi:hypothetical protein
MREVEKFGYKIKCGLGSSTGDPDFKGMQTADIKEWIWFSDKWFKCYGGFRWRQIQLMIDICTSEGQLIALMELLAADKYYENIK